MLGPVQVLVVGFEAPTYSGEVLAELARLERAGIVRLIDLLLVSKTDDGAVETVEETLLPGPYGELAVALLGAPGEAGDAAGEAASWSLADAVPDGQSAAVALIEHTWASPLREAILRNGGRSLDETWLAPEDHARLEALLAGRDATAH
jgi:uncharacterized membrane protein